MKHSALEMQRVTKSYGSGATEMTALDAVSLQLPKGGVHSNNGTIWIRKEYSLAVR